MLLLFVAFPGTVVRNRSPAWVTDDISTASYRHCWSHAKNHPWAHYCYSGYTDGQKSVCLPAMQEGGRLLQYTADLIRNKTIASNALNSDNSTGLST